MLSVGLLGLDSQQTVRVHGQKDSYWLSGLPQVAQQQFLKHAGTCLMVQNHGLETHMNRPLGQQ